jgi:hypothetical protein
MLGALLALLDGPVVLALSAFFLALLAREAAVVLIVLAVLWRDGAPIGSRPSARAFSRYVPLVAVLLVYLALRGAVAGTSPAGPAKSACPVSAIQRKRTPIAKSPIAKWMTIGW